MESFKDFLRGKGIDVVETDGDNESLILQISKDNLAKILNMLAIEPTEEPEGEFQEFSNKDGNGVGIKYHIDPETAIRFNGNEDETDIDSVNIWNDSGETPSTLMDFKGINIEDIIEEIMALIKSKEGNNFEKDFEVKNMNRKKRIPMEVVNVMTEEGLKTEKQLAFKMIEEGKYQLGTDVLNSSKDVVETLWSRGYNKNDIISISKLSEPQVKSTLKTIGAIKTIDVRPGYKEKIITKK
jgi:hypothetical protein